MQAERKIQFFYSLFFLLTTSFSHQPLLGRVSVYFAPDDQPRRHLIGYIKRAKKQIYAAVYMLTDKKIVDALIEAKKRNVDVQIITDITSVDSEYGKAKMLAKNKVKTYVFKTKTPATSFRRNPLMHNKFAVIDKNVWTGSFNWTVSANTKNQENVICTNAKSVREKFLAYFKKLKKRCRSVGRKTS
jgi:phosphatidylserine/phosphatidylglycerophosphate/cardiolipin synthase-like enzyme